MSGWVTRPLRRPSVAQRAVQGASISGHIIWVLGLFGLVGLLSALVWVWLWTPAEGLVIDGQLVLLGDGPRQAFDGTGWYLVIGAVVGLVSGLVVGILARSNELVTLCLVVVGAVGAALVMRWVGHGLGPPDPTPIAARSEDYTTLPVDLALPGLTPTLALPIGALAGFLIALVLCPTRRGIVHASGGPVGTMPR